MNQGSNTIVLGFLIFVQGCNAAPAKGSELPPRTDGVAVLNEPCYVHDGACDGYPVCCVTAGTCISKHSGTVSSTTAYYEGGCQSMESSKKEWSEKHKNAGCVQQGECMIQHIGACKGGFTKPGFLTEVPKETLDRFMAGSCEVDCVDSNYGHRSSGGDSDETTTTTTTVLTRHTADITLAVSDTSAVDVEKLTHMVKRTLGIMSGYGASHSAITVEAPSLSSTMTFTYHIDVSSSHQVMGKPVTVDDVKASIEGMADSRINEVLAMMIGSCSYTAVVTDPPAADTLTPSTAHGAANIVVAMMATVSAAVLADFS